MRQPGRAGLALVMLAGFLLGCGGGDAPESTDASGDLPRKLAPGETFPVVGVYDGQGNERQTSDLLDGRTSLVFFIDPGCSMCREVTEIWKDLRDTIPTGLNVLGILEDEPAFVASYAERNAYPYPLFADDAAIFATRYGMEAYPAVVAVRPDRSIIYVGTGINENFTPERAMEMIEDVNSGRGLQP